MVASSRLPGGRLPALFCAGLLVLSGCGKDDVARTFTGGSSSKDKKPIPSTVNASAASAVGGAASGAPAEGPAADLEGPAVAVKAQSSSGSDDGPIRKMAMKYRSAKSRDPFRSLIQEDEKKSSVVDLSVVTLVGIVSGEDPFCIVEDAEGVSYVLRKGDRVKNGRVVAIRKDSMVASQTILGYTTTVQLKLEERKDISHG